MIKKKRTKKGNLKVAGGMADFIDSVDMLTDGINNPEFQRYIGQIIAQYAVKLAKENVWNGGKPSEPHAEWYDEKLEETLPITEILTEKLSDGKRQTGSVLMERDSGGLYDAIKVTSSTVAMGKMHVDIGIIDEEIAKYALIQEYGGHPGGAVGPGKSGHAGYIPARPYLIPAIREAAYSGLESPELQEAIMKALDAMSNGKNWRVHFQGVKI